ncbi:putative manganese transporter [Vibrio sinaloensis]|uniref:putative manganese transporter n=1 Tax=Photobacterium sp. (strain ATCC 43367) TaxID=379097 RepID=UPI00205C9485|nr:putative manganese transporter [Vibrio sinaloensis]UPQ86996.1 putative manganese transporter [Vibrio sinaloensis]
MDSIKISTQTAIGFKLAQFRPAYRRLLLPIGLITLLLAPQTRQSVLLSLADAYWAVACYVAFTLSLYHYLARLFRHPNRVVNLYHSSPTYQVLFASLLGALPGCGGAIVVTTQFVSGRVGFGALVAVLTSTMGDAAFLLLASQPKTGLVVIVVGCVVGCLTGWCVNVMHHEGFLRPKHTSTSPTHQCCRNHSPSIEQTAINLQGKFWQWLLLPSAIIAGLNSFQVDINSLLSLPTLTMEWIGAVLIVVSMLLWSLTKEISDYQSTVAEDCKSFSSHPMQKAAQDTNFVTAWVVVAFVAFELIQASADIQMSAILNDWGPWMPMAGMIIGLLPGCGPQILVTSLYLSGAAPLSTQLSNAIANDGDALFPAIAFAPKAALVASLYSALPALLIGYGYYWLFE